MSPSIIEQVLYNNPANLERLRLILTPLNYEIQSIYTLGKNGDLDTSVATIRLDTDPGDTQGRGENRYKEAQIQYPRINIELAFRSKLAVVDNWVLMDLPEHGRAHTLTDVIRYLRTKEIRLESRFFKLHQLTRDHYMLSTTPDSPRFMESVTFKSVSSIPHQAFHDRDMYTYFDFNMTDMEYLSAWSNYRTYLLCFTPTNASVVSSSNVPDSTATNIMIRIDKQAHIQPHIGIGLFPNRFYTTLLTVERMLGSDLVKHLGFETALPLGYALEVRSAWDLIPRINELYDLGLTKQDIVDMRIDSNLTRIRFRTTCLAYAGEMLVDIKGQETRS